MTGRELIIHILLNGLEDEPVFKNGKLIGFITIGEAAAKKNIGVATIATWISMGLVDCALIGDTLYVPMNFDIPSDTTI